MNQPDSRKFPFQRTIKPDNDYLGRTLCPACNTPVPVSLDQWLANSPLACPCGWSAYYNFQTAKTEVIANQLSTPDLFY